MRAFRFRSDVERALNSLSERVAVLEEEARISKALRESRANRRDWWVSKMLPTIGSVIIAVLGLNAVFKFF